MSTRTPALELSQPTAPIVTIAAANGVTYAYRRFGAGEHDRPPLLFLQHRALGREYIRRAFGRTEGADKPNGPRVPR